MELKNTAASTTSLRLDSSLLIPEETRSSNEVLLVSQVESEGHGGRMVTHGPRRTEQSGTPGEKEATLRTVLDRSALRATPPR